MTVRADFTNGHDICHGGYIFMLADSAFAYACNNCNRNTVASAANIEFIKPAILYAPVRWSFPISSLVQTKPLIRRSGVGKALADETLSDSLHSSIRPFGAVAVGGSMAAIR